MSKEKKIGYQQAIAQDESVMQSNFRGLFLTTPVGKELLFYMLTNWFCLYAKIENEEMRIRHNIGTDLMEKCGLLHHGYRPQNLFADMTKARKLTVWQFIKARVRRMS